MAYVYVEPMSVISCEMAYVYVEPMSVYSNQAAPDLCHDLSSETHQLFWNSFH